MIHGHTHVDERFAVYEKYVRNPMLIINNMCHRMEDEFSGGYERTPCVARWREGKLPAVYRIKLDPTVLNAISPPPQES
jgi:hypothetical protein